MRPETLTPQPSVGADNSSTVGLESAGRGPALRRPDAVRVRFNLGLIGLFAAYVTVFLAAWAVIPSLVPGWQPVVITSGSMAPSIQTGDVVVASPSNGQGLSTGAVIVISDPAQSGLTTHRIVSVNADGSYRTQGDANSGVDSTPVQPEHVIATGRLLVPHAGLPLVWYRKGAWLQLGLWGLLVVTSLWLARYAYQPMMSPGVPGRDAD